MSREYRAWFDTAMQQSLAPRQCLVYNISASGWAWCVNIYVLLSSHAANEKAMATQANSSKHLPECYSRWNTVLWLPPRCTPAPLKALWKIGKAKKVEGSTKPKPYYTTVCNQKIYPRSLIMRTTMRKATLTSAITIRCCRQHSTSAS